MNVSSPDHKLLLKLIANAQALADGRSLKTYERHLQSCTARQLTQRLNFLTGIEQESDFTSSEYRIFFNDRLFGVNFDNRLYHHVMVIRGSSGNAIRHRNGNLILD